MAHFGMEQFSGVEQLLAQSVRIPEISREEVAIG
jgi:hypothetical protein